MHTELHYGRLMYLSFLALDLVCLVIANILSLEIYIGNSNIRYNFTDHYSVIIVMIVIDIGVTFVFSTLRRVLRWRKRRELYESARHVLFCFTILGLYMFITKNGSGYSRAVVTIAYILDFVFIAFCRTALRFILSRCIRKPEKPNVLLMTTDRFVDEGIEKLKQLNYNITDLFLLKNINKTEINGIPVATDVKEVASIICWKMISRVYIYGPDTVGLPEDLLTSCKQMSVPVYVLPAKKSLEFEVVKIRTALQKDDTNTGLSFFEGEHDIPFKINRIYTIFESEQDNQKGYHAHKQSWHFLFCPFGSIAVIVDTGKERKTILLSDPSTGLILHPGLWREIIWKKTGSILCVAASGHYDSDKLRNNYYEYLKFLQAREWSAMIESAEIVREA